MTKRFKFVGLAAMVMLGMNLPGCASSSRSPYARQREVARDPERARQLHAQATRIAEKDPAETERLLRDALVADIYHAPSHNNLGVLMLEQGRLYEAASEFEWARKLMPGHPDPRVNLAMTLEKAGKIEDALVEYESALAAWNDYLPALQGKARLQVTRGRTDDSTLAALDEIVLRGDSQWREWAELWRVKLGRDPA